MINKKFVAQHALIFLVFLLQGTGHGSKRNKISNRNTKWRKKEKNHQIVFSAAGVFRFLCKSQTKRKTSCWRIDVFWVVVVAPWHKAPLPEGFKNILVSRKRMDGWMLLTAKLLGLP